MIFLADIFVGFHVGYEKLGVVVCDKALVRSYYLRTHFAWDLIAALPVLMWPVSLYAIACDDKGGCIANWLYVLAYYIPLLQLSKIPSSIARATWMRETLSDAWGTTACDMIMLVVLFVRVYLYACVCAIVLPHSLTFSPLLLLFFSSSSPSSI